MQQAIAANNAQALSTNPRQELRTYLESPLEPVDDVVGWWGVRII
jgi:hypothetical protein